MSSRCFLGPGVVLAVLLGAAPAGAYCRTYTCQATKSCELVDGCWVGGHPLFWPERCISFSVNERGSPLRGIVASDAEAALDRAYSTWEAVDCGGGPPSIEIFQYPQVACDVAEFNQCDENANLWVFLDEWPYEDGGLTLAQTWVHFDTKTGRILDADVEVNTAEYEIGVGSAAQREHFIAIATHEIGHVLGLDHSPRLDATMYTSYSRVSDLSVLSDDDSAGLCEIYPTDRVAGACDPEPRNGFSADCGTVECEDPGCCSTAAGRAASSGPWGGVAAALALVAVRGRRRRRVRR